MKHNHRITPGYKGGEYTEENTILVEVIQCDLNRASHAMWHYANWRLWGREEDRLAWKGLAGFLNKEEIIEHMMAEARKKACESYKKTAERLMEEGKLALMRPEVRKKALESTLKTQRMLVEQGAHPFQNPEVRAKKAKKDAARCKELFDRGLSYLQRPEVIEKRKVRSSEFISSLNSTPAECPHCGKVGGYVNMKRYHFDRCKLA